MGLEAAILRHWQVIALLLAALLQGTIYLLLVPPWQHYDEPTHFEYAWLIANRGRLPELNDVDTTMRREVAASMVVHNFYQNLPPPDLLAEGHGIYIGISELGHPPTYYLLASLPLRLARYLDVTSQLYVARGVSLLLFVLTVGLVWAAMRELTREGSSLRWAVPLGVVLLPPFADLMTAVNNDAGAIFVFTLFVWLAVRTIGRGLSWRRVALLTATALLAVKTKNTASIALLLLPLVWLLSAATQRGWSWQRSAALVFGATSVAILATLGWGDPAFWYRDSTGNTQAEPARIQTERAQHGDYAIMLEAAPRGPRQLLNPLVFPDVEQLGGSTVTVGAWVWADHPTDSARLSLLYSPPGFENAELAGMPVTLTTDPQFVSWTADVPPDAQQLLFALSLAPTTTAPRVMLDGVVVTKGTFGESPPQFEDATGQRGQWNGEPFRNLLRNGSGEQAWPRLRPWLDAALGTYARRSPTQVIAALFDVERTWPSLLTVTLGEVLFTFFGTFGWSQVELTRGLWLPVFQGLAVVAVLGCGWWLLSRRRQIDSTLNAQVVLLGMAGMIVWGNVLVRVLPLLDGVPIFAIARYGFPAILPAMLALVGGWRHVWPRRLRAAALPTLLVGLFVLNGWSIWTIRHFYLSWLA